MVLVKKVLLIGDMQPRKMYDYLQILSDGTDGKVSLFKEPMIRRMGEYISRTYVGNGWVVNFCGMLLPRVEAMHR